MSKKKVLILGGRGLLGSQIKSSLIKLNEYNIYTCDRSNGKKNHIKGDITNEDFCKKNLKKFDVVVNCIGLSPIRRPPVPYSDVHVWGVRNLLFYMKSSAKLIHISALGANSSSNNEYLRTKGKADELISGSKLNYTIFRPGLILSKNSEFFSMLEKTKRLRLFANIPAKVQPVIISSVAKEVVNGVQGNYSKKIVELGGNRVLTIGTLAKEYLQSKQYNPFLIPYLFVKPFFILACYLKLFGFGKEQLDMPELDSIFSNNHMKKIKYGFDEFLDNL